MTRIYNIEKYSNYIFISFQDDTQLVWQLQQQNLMPYPTQQLKK